jgi:penicillin-binding protein 1C
MRVKSLAAARVCSILLSRLSPKTRLILKRAGLTAVILSGLLFFLGLLARYSPYPELERFQERRYSIRIYDRGGGLLQITSLEDGLRREYCPLEDIPGILRSVFIFSEDARFYRHPGIDIPAILRAAWLNLSQKRLVSGASTITMQLARLISAEASGWNPSPDYGRKLAEALNALRLEARLSKDEILELYLNSLPFGFQTEGVASAARNFFASDLKRLSPAEIFCLAVIPRRPAAYNPHTKWEACVEAAENLRKRYSLSPSADPLAASTNAGDFGFAAGRVGRFVYPLEAPHLIRHIQNEAFYPRRGDLRLSIDLSLQKRIEALIARDVQSYYSQRLNNGAAIVLDNASGEILAWVGSADYGNTEHAGQIDGVLALNQSGSSMKPFLYALALENGFNPADVIADIPLQFGSGELYFPRNFNNRYNGPMLFRSALASSLNVPAVYLLYRLGLLNYINFLRSLGFYSLEDAEERAGLALALGDSPVSLLELCRAFSIFPNDGALIPLSFQAGLASSSPVTRPVSADTARLISSILSDRNARVLGFGRAGNFSTPFQAIFKTGTANQYQSIVALGATPRYTAAVWMGNFTGETVVGTTGSSIPALIVRDTLIYLQGNSGPVFREPENYSLRRVCSLSGMEPAEACPFSISEYVRHETVQESCTWHYREDGRTRIRYPPEYQAWFLSSSKEGELDYRGAPLEIVLPLAGAVYYRGEGAASVGREEIPVEITGGAYDEIEVRYDDTVFNAGRPFRFYLPCEAGEHTLRVFCGEETASVSYTVDPS